MCRALILLCALVCALAGSVQGQLPTCNLPPPATTVLPKRYHVKIPLQSLNWMWFDGLSPSLPGSTAATTPSAPNTLTMTLQGRGSSDPQNMDPFGSGMRISSQYAYKAGKICANMVASTTYSGTVFGMYIIDAHPPGPKRSTTTWREADFEWLGRAGQQSNVDITAWPWGLDKYSSQTKSLSPLGPGASIQSNARYCITWDFQPATGKYVLWEAALSGKPMQTMRRWTPPDASSNTIYSEPVKVVFTVWSTNQIVGWAGAYSMPATSQMKVTFSNISFQPIGQAYCPKNDGDLQPLAVGSQGQPPTGRRK